MNGYEKILKIMKEKGKKESEIKLGVVLDNMRIDTGELVLDRDDLLIPDILLNGYTAADGSIKEPLSEGDIVLVVRLSDVKYAVLGRVQS